MAKTAQDELPDKLRPYKFHGLELTKSTKGNYISTCPFCDKSGKFSIKEDSGVARCWSCGVGGEKGGLNGLSFLRTLYTESLESTTIEDYHEVAVQFNLLFQDTPKHWGLAKSISTGRWIAPGYTVDGKIMTLYQLTRIKAKGKYKHTWLPTPEHGQHLCYEAQAKFKSRIYLCEGLKDAMAWWEILNHSMEGTDGKLLVTNSKSKAIIRGSTVMAITGVNVFKEDYLKMFKDKEVILLFDSDHPGKNEKTGKETPSAGLEGVKRFATRLINSKSGKPSSIKWLDWGGTGLGYDPSLPSGTDINDYLSKDSLNA